MTDLDTCGVDIFAAPAYVAAELSPDMLAALVDDTPEATARAVRQQAMMLARLGSTLLAWEAQRANSDPWRDPDVTGLLAAARAYRQMFGPDSPAALDPVAEFIRAAEALFDDPNVPKRTGWGGARRIEYGWLQRASLPGLHYAWLADLTCWLHTDSEPAPPRSRRRWWRR